MKSRIKEQGSALHIVIIVVLIIALLGALGFIFYQNFIKQDAPVSNTVPDTSQQTEDEEEAGTYKGTRVVALSGVYSIKIPNGWKVTRNTDSTSNIQQSMGPNGLEYDESKSPVVTDELIGGHDALIFSIGVQDGDIDSYDGETATEFKTDSGLVGKRVERSSLAADNVGSMYESNDVYLYHWTFSKDNEQFVYISWASAYEVGKTPDRTFLQLLDDVARTLEIR